MKFKAQILLLGILPHCCCARAQHYIPWKYYSGLNFDRKQQLWWLRWKNWAVSWCLSIIECVLIKSTARSWICIWNASAVFGDVSVAKRSWRYTVTSFSICWLYFLYFFMVESLKPCREVRLFPHCGLVGQSRREAYRRLLWLKSQFEA